MKKIFLLLLALPMFATAQPVQVPYSCGAGNAFTIRIPVKTRGMSVEYVWYRNDTVVAEVPLTAGVTTIAYTVPDTLAHGSSMFHFKYRLNDGCNEWTASPKYAVTFLPPAQASAIAGNTTACAGTIGLIYSVEFAEGVSYDWTVPAGWAITAGQGDNSITVTAGDAGGTVSVTPSNSGGSGAVRTLTVAIQCSCPAVSAPGSVGFSLSSCSGSMSSAGAIGFALSPCSGSVSSAGAVGFAPSPCSGSVSSAGTVGFAPSPCSGSISSAGAISFTAY